jgi:hypothetical protein
MQAGILDASRLAEQVILVKLSTDKQMIKYAQHLSGKSDYANFSASSRINPQEELLEFREFLC